MDVLIFIAIAVLALAFLGGCFSMLHAILRSVADYLVPAPELPARAPATPAYRRTPSRLRDRVFMVILASGIVGAVMQALHII